MVSAGDISECDNLFVTISSRRVKNDRQVQLWGEYRGGGGGVVGGGREGERLELGISLFKRGEVSPA